MKHTFKQWLIAVRPWSFPASSMPVIVSFCYLLWAGYDVNLWLALWALGNIVVFHAAGNTWSDYFDFKKEVDRDDTFGVKTMTTNMFSSQEIMRLSLGLLAVALTSGLVMMCVVGWQLLWIGLGGLVCSVCYPFFKYHALGDLDIFIAYALLPALGTSFVATGTFHPDVFYAVVPVGLITVGILHVNNTRDREPDRRAGIVTFAILVGRKASAVIYVLELALPYLLTTIFLAVCGTMPILSVLMWLTFPLAIGNIRAMQCFLTEGEAAIGTVDVRTAMLQMLYSLTLSISLVAAWILRGTL